MFVLLSEVVFSIDTRIRICWNISVLYSLLTVELATTHQYSIIMVYATSNYLLKYII